MNNLQRTIWIVVIGYGLWCQMSLSQEPTVGRVGGPQKTLTTSERQWTDATGAYKVFATVIAVEDGFVRLKRRDGRVVRLSINKLSEADQAYLREQSKARESIDPPTQQHKSADAPTIYYQLINIHRRPRHQVSGLDVLQNVQYAILSRLKVTAKQGLAKKVEQYIVETKLIQADALSRQIFAEPLAKLQGKQIFYSFDGENQLTEVKGLEAKPAAKRVRLPGADGFLLTSIIDEDGWKELTQLTFFQPKADSTRQWKQPIQHKWQPLGGWAGTTTFTKRTGRRSKQQVDFKHAIYYAPPKDGDHRLPFRIRNADFQALTSAGTITYNSQAERVDQVVEQFHVRGAVAVELLGVETKIGVEEKQELRIQLFNEDPRGKSP